MTLRASTHKPGLPRRVPHQPHFMRCTAAADAELDDRRFVLYFSFMAPRRASPGRPALEGGGGGGGGVEETTLLLMMMQLRARPRTRGARNNTTAYDDATARAPSHLGGEE